MKSRNLYEVEITQVRRFTRAVSATSERKAISNVLSTVKGGRTGKTTARVVGVHKRNIEGSEHPEDYGISDEFLLEVCSA